MEFVSIIYKRQIGHLEHVKLPEYPPWIKLRPTIYRKGSNDHVFAASLESNNTGFLLPTLTALLRHYASIVPTFHIFIPKRD